MARGSILAALLLVVSAALTVSAQSSSLFDTLRSVDASLFADWIQSDPELAAFYTSSNVKTVYAPNDAAFQAFNSTNSEELLRRLWLRQGNSRSSHGRGQTTKETVDIFDAAPPSPSSLTSTTSSSSTSTSSPTSLSAPVVRRAASATSLSTPSTTAAVVSINLEGPYNGSQAVIQRIALPPSSISKRAAYSVVLTAGLGNNVSVITANTRYDSGIIHTVDGFFTLPQSFSSTFNQTNATSFAGGLTTTGLGSVLENATAVTVFSTPNEVYQAGVGNSTNAATSSILSNQIIPNYLGYSPLLTNGTTLTTQGGSKVTVTIKNGDYYVNNAKIIAFDQITSNGVAHVVDSFITPTTPQVPISTGAAASNKVGGDVSIGLLTALSSVLLFLL